MSSRSLGFMVESGRARLTSLFATARTDGRALLCPYLTAGLPDIESSVSLFESMSDAGADAFEVGIPYADPLMDGPTIHTAGLRALDAGTTIERAIEIVGLVATRTGRPTIVMTYVNPVLRYGAEEFGTMAAEAGASAVIVADLPVDEAEPFREAFRAAGLDLVLFVAPTTNDHRLATITALDPVFLYGIAQLGVTGEREEAGAERAALLAGRVRAATATPLVLGVGIATSEHVRMVAQYSDGVIVGSALVRQVLDAGSVGEAAAQLFDSVSDLAAAVRR